MKKFLSLLLSLCLLLGTLPLQVSAFAGDIFPSEGAVKTVTLEDGSLSLQNEYIHMTFRKLWGTYAYLTVAPAAKPDEESILIGQTPRCTFTTYDQGREKTEGVVTEPIKAEFVTKTPNGSANAIKVEYSLLTSLSLIKAKATVYYELVQLKENGASSDTWVCWRRSVRFTSTKTVCHKIGIVTTVFNGGIRSTALPPRDIPPRWKSRAVLPLK